MSLDFELIVKIAFLSLGGAFLINLIAAGLWLLFCKIISKIFKKE